MYISWDVVLNFNNGNIFVFYKLQFFINLRLISFFFLFFNYIFFLILVYILAGVTVLVVVPLVVAVCLLVAVATADLLTADEMKLPMLTGEKSIYYILLQNCFLAHDGILIILSLSLLL